MKCTWKKTVSLVHWYRRMLLYRRLKGLYDESCRKWRNSVGVWCTKPCGFVMRRRSCATRERRPNARPVPLSARPGTVSQDPSTARRKTGNLHEALNMITRGYAPRWRKPASSFLRPTKPCRHHRRRCECRVSRSDRRFSANDRSWDECPRCGFFCLISF